MEYACSASKSRGKKTFKVKNGTLNQSYSSSLLVAWIYLSMHRFTASTLLLCVLLATATSAQGLAERE